MLRITTCFCCLSVIVSEMSVAVVGYPQAVSCHCACLLAMRVLDYLPFAYGTWLNLPGRCVYVCVCVLSFVGQAAEARGPCCVYLRTMVIHVVSASCDLEKTKPGLCAVSVVACTCRL